MSNPGVKILLGTAVVSLFVLPRVRPLARRLLSRLQVDELLLALDRLPPHAHVQPDHDGDGHEEGNHHGHDGHVLVGVDELDVAVVVGHRALALDVRPGHDPGGGDDKDIGGGRDLREERGQNV